MMVLIVGPARAESLMQKIAGALDEAARPATVFVTDTGKLPDVPQLRLATILVTLAVPCGAREMDAMPLLRGIVSPLLGYEWIDLETATLRSIPVVNGEILESRESMAEATIMLILALLYRLQDTEAELRHGGEKIRGRNMLKGRTVGIVGYGGITREIIHRLRNWQAPVLVHTRGRAEQIEGVSFVSIDHLLAASDVLVLMTRLDSGTRRFLNRSRLKQLKRGVLIVNTARGGLVDEDALIEALESGHVGAAALDVFEVEPLPIDHPFRRLANVVLTPHAVGHTVQMFDQIPLMAASNVLELLEGKIPDSCKNIGELRPR